MLYCYSCHQVTLSNLVIYLLVVSLQQPEHQQLIVDAGALPPLVNLLRRQKNTTNSRVVNSVIKRAADAITNLAHENSNIKTVVRFLFYASLIFDALWKVFNCC